MKKTLMAGALLASLTWMGSAVAGGGCPATPDAWDVSNAANGGTLAVTAGGALSTACKLTVTNGPNNNGIATVRDDMATPGEPRYRARFYVDTQNLVGNMAGATQRVKAFVAANPNNTYAGTNQAPNAVMQIFLVGLDAGGLRLGGFCRSLGGNGDRTRFGDNQDGNPGTGDLLSLQDGWNSIEVEIVIGNGDGACRIWVNNSTEGSPNWEVTGINNADWVGIERSNIGFTGSTIPFATNHSAAQVHFDEFDSRRSTFIGQ